MPRHGENIRKRKDGRWEARYKIPTADGTSFLYRSVYANTYREVKEKRQRQLADIAVDAPQNKTLLFRDVLSLWLKQNRIRLKGATLYRYKSLIQAHILPWLGDLPLQELTSSRINLFLEQKRTCGRLDGSGSLSASYVRSILLIVKAALDFAAGEAYCAPIRNRINKPQLIQKEIPILNKESQEKLLHICIAEPDSTKIGILLSLYAGLRVGEVCALSWEDVDWQSHCIHIRHTIARVIPVESNTSQTAVFVVDTPKTQASRRCIPINSVLYDVLCTARLTSSSAYVISNTPTPINPRTFEYRYHRLLRSHDIPDVKYHALRHTFATRCIETGTDVKTLSELLGHSNAAVTLNTYVHSSLDMKRQCTEKLLDSDAF